MALGFGHLKLSSRAFWSLTPRELASAAKALGATDQALAFNRADLSLLMKNFPDP